MEILVKIDSGHKPKSNNILPKTLDLAARYSLIKLEIGKSVLKMLEARKIDDRSTLFTFTGILNFGTVSNESYVFLSDIQNNFRMTHIIFCTIYDFVIRIKRAVKISKIFTEFP